MSNSKLSDDALNDIASKIKPHVLAGEIHYGWGAHLLVDQLGHSDETIEHFQKDADAIGRLVVRSVIVPSAAQKARDRLTKHIYQHMLEIGALVEGKKDV
jgi:hypothetical protein